MLIADCDLRGPESEIPYVFVHIALIKKTGLEIEKDDGLIKSDDTESVFINMRSWRRCMITDNKIEFRLRVKELVIDWLVIWVYLITLFLLSILFYLSVFHAIPVFSEGETQMIATTTSVVPVVLFFSYLDFKDGSIGKNRAGLCIYYKNRKFKYSLLRNVIKFLPWQIGHVGVIHGMYSEFNAISILIQWMAIACMIGLFGMGTVRKDKRHLGDIVAGTQVQIAK